jgi:transcriptional regulator with XRE-family HTH domain
MAKSKDFVQRKLDKTVENVCANIKEIRNRRGYTQEKLGELSGLGRIRIVEVEGQRYCPTIPTLNILAIALGVEVYQFLLPNPNDIKLQ